ncbi:MAG TPA: DoxX family protein [Candidatus Angelobacter sp.]
MANQAQHMAPIGAEPLAAESQAPTEVHAAKPVATWNFGVRLAFRFCFVYFTLYCLSNQIIGGLLIIPKLDFPELGTIWPLRQVTFWIASHVFGVTRPLVYTGSGSGDKTFDWIQTLFLLAFSVLVMAIWSVFDRRRKNYAVLAKWFRLFIRFALASEMLSYGFAKLIPLQMPFPFLTRLMEPYGNFAPMSVLWFSVGASHSYEIFTGCAETLGGLLLIFPRTAMLGALVCTADMIQVFTLNMTYDVPVKLLSFHLLVLALFLLAPEGRRTFTFLFSGRATEPSSQRQLFRGLRANRVAVIVQVVFGLYLVGMNLYSEVQSWYTYGGGRPKPSLYGIWNVEQMSIDGVVRSPLLTDSDRWRRVIFDFIAFTQFQRMDDTFAGFGSTIDDKGKTLLLTKPADKNWKASFTFDRPAQDQLALDGSMDGHKIHMQLKLLDRSKLMLVNRGFHWINEYPFQR